MENPKDKIKEILERAKNNAPSINDGSKSLTGLAFRPSGEISALPDRYKDIGDKLGWNPNTMLYPDMEKEAYLNQGGGEVLANTIAGFGTQALAGVIDSVAAYDMKGLYDMSVGNTEQQYGNWLNEIGKNIREYGDENFQIYQDGDSMWNTSYWAKQAQSLGYTGGIIAETIAEQVALAYLTGGGGNAAGIASKTRLLKMGGQGLFGMWKGVQEGYMNALETQGNVYKKYKELGYDEAEAQKKANEAATLGFRAEVGPLAVLNTLQFMTTFGVAKSAFTRGAGPNLGFSGGVETLIDRALPSITNKYAKNAIGFGVNALSEGVEEGIQTGISKYAQHETLKSTGNASENLDIWDKEMRDSVIGGVLGGGLFAGVGKLYNKYTQGTAAKQYSKAHDSFLSDAINRTSNAFADRDKVQKEYEQANIEYNRNKSKVNLDRLQRASQMVKEAQYNIHLTNTVNALQLDYLNGKTTAFETHVEQMQILLDATKSGDVETLKKYNILDENNKEKFDGSIDVIKNTFEQNIKDSYLIKEKLENNLLNVTSDFEIAFDITKKQYLNIKNLEDISKYNTALNTLYSNDTQFKQLSDSAKNRFKLELELESFNKLDKLSSLNEKRKLEIREQLKDTEDYSANDSRILDSIHKTPYLSAYISINSLGQAIDDTNKDIATSTKEDVITEKIKNRTVEKIEKAKTVETLEQISEDLGLMAQDDETNSKITALLAGKKDELLAQELIKEGNPNFTIDSKRIEDTNEGLEIEQLSKELGDLQSDRPDYVQEFTPRELSTNISDSKKEQIKEVVKNYEMSLKSELQKNVTFEDIIKDRINKSGYENAEKSFNAYKYMWEISGKDVSNYTAIYNKYFNSAQQFEEIAQTLFDEDTYTETTNRTVDNAIDKNSKPTSFDNNNRPVGEDGVYTRVGKTSIPTPKAAFLGVQYEDVVNEDKTITRRPIIPQLNVNKGIANNFVLDPDYIKVGVKLEVSIPEDVNSVIVADWVFNKETNSFDRQELSFGDWVNKYNIEVGSTRYNNKVPMVARFNGDNIFYLHDTDWYNISNIDGVDEDSKKENIKNGIIELQTVRKAILNGKNQITINNRRFGNIFRLNQLKDNKEIIPLSEATGETTLTIATKYTVLSDSKGEIKTNLVNNLEDNNFNIGQLYEIREVNTNQYIALPVFTNNVSEGQLLNDVAYNNVKFALISSIILNANRNTTILTRLEEKYGITLSKAQNIQEEIKRTSGIDIIFEFDNYISMFVKTIYNRNLKSVLESEEVNKKTGKLKFPTGINYIVADNGIIKIVKKIGGKVSVDKTGNVFTPFINLRGINENSSNSIMSFLDTYFNDSDSSFRNTPMDFSLKQLGENKPFVTITENGTVVPYKNKGTYEDYIKDNVKTNVKSFPITNRDGKTKWVTDVQPMIYYNIDSNEELKLELPVEDKITEATELAIEKLKQSDDNIKEAINSLPDHLKQQLKGFHIEGFEDPDFSFSRRELSLTETEDIASLNSNLVSSLSPIQQKKLIGSLFNLILSDIKSTNNNYKLSIISENIYGSIDKYIVPEINRLQQMINNLTELNNDSVSVLIDNFNKQKERLDKIVEEKHKIISNGSIKDNAAKGDLYKKFERFLGEELSDDPEKIEQDTDNIDEDNNEEEHNFSKLSFERDVKLTFSNNLKIFFSGIKKQNPRNKEDVKNFAYLNDFEEVDDVIQYLVEVMVGLPSSMEDLISILESKKNNTIYSQILHKIKNTNESTKNEILYKLIQSKLDMYMVLYSYNSDNNTYSLVIKNPDNSFINKLEKQWLNNFENSGLFRVINEQYIYNDIALKKLLEDIDKLKDKNKITEEDIENVRNIFDRIGITISDNTLKSLIASQGNNILSNSGIIGIFYSNLKLVLDNIDKEEYRQYNRQSVESNPFRNSRGVLTELKELETSLNGTRVSKSFRVNGKSIQGAIQKMMIYDVKEELKDLNSNYSKALSEIPYSKNNYVLKFLQNIDKFRNFFDIGFVSLEAIKQNRQKSYNDRKINKLANTDNMLVQYAFFQNTIKELKEIPSNIDNLNIGNLVFRMGHMFNPSLSDKEQMIVYSTALLDLNYKNFNLLENDKVTPNTEVIDFITRQIFDSEFDRIISAYKNPTNIKSYDNAAKRFLSIPEFNNLQSKNGSNIHTVIKTGMLDPNTDFNIVKEQFRESAMEVMLGTLESELKEKINIDNMSGNWFDAGFLSLGKKRIEISHLDNRYLLSKKGKNYLLNNSQIAQIAALDFIINQFLSQHTTYQLVAGDLALYAPSIGKYTNKQTKEIDNIAFSKAVGESVTKRMAMLIAPGNKLANSKDDKYLQIFVNDPIKMTSTAREFIKQYYGAISENNEKLLTELQNIEDKIQEAYNVIKDINKLETVLEGSDTEVGLYSKRSTILKTLEETNPEIGGYFNIEGTDAQEYTTWKEHIDILFRQGRLTEEEKLLLTSAYNKLISGEELDTEELSVVMNPIKPVYAGTNTFRDKDGNPNVNRVVYIKSSSFPLLPQLTKDFKLNKIREQMESLQNTTGKNVRLSYQTANKIGSITTKLTVDDLYNIPFQELYLNGNGKLAQSVLELDRNNFKIQQDTPYKTAKFLKKNQDDMTTMGSQIWKVILGNGINKINAKIFPNLFGQDLINNINRKLQAEGKQIIPQDGMISGRDLDRIKFYAEQMYFDIQKELLYDELGFDRDTRKPVDINTTIKLLHKLLLKEVTTRQYPDSLVDSLNLVKDKEQFEFILPIWLSNGSNKFESLLQSIISSRLINIDLPGNQHISASSEGFERVTSLEEIENKIKSQIVWVDPNHTGELKATIINGKVIESEILIQSKFRKTYRDDKGELKTKLIDLTKEPYSRIENGILVLNTNMIDNELLNSFSFRIPTSSHQSGAILKVVGFLPEASGDMLVVPKEHTKQIGEDFDIDKRTVYKSNYKVDKNGVISKLNWREEFTSEDKLLYDIFSVDYSHLNSESDKTKFFELKQRVKMLENAMIDVYKSVYLSPDNNIQKKINKILSFDNASNTVALIQSKINSGTNKYFSTYSDNYQRQQMKLGADGKTGIGGHSNAVTFQAQMERLDNKIEIRKQIILQNGTTRYSPKFITIGEYTSDGTLGEIETLDGERTVGDVHTENQNSATDNIKAQIMGKRNENAYTMNVLIQMTYRRFDMFKFFAVQTKDGVIHRFGSKDKKDSFVEKNKQNVSVSYNSLQGPSLFISQPILRRYVELKEQDKSITSGFSSDSDTNIIKQLIREFGLNEQYVKYSKNGQLIKTEFMDNEQYKILSSRMTADVLYDNLSSTSWDSGIQLAVLQKFFELEEEARNLSEYQSLINMNTSKLGISFFNVLDRIELVNKLGNDELFLNIRDLVGTFVYYEDFIENPPKNSSEYTRIGQYYIKPTTSEGTVLVQSLSSAEDIMDILYPYKRYYINNIVNRILVHKDKKLSKKRKTELQYKIVSSIKDYLYSLNSIGFFSGDVNTERFRLFFDKDDNTSLAKYLKELKDSKKYPLMYTNELLKSLSFDNINSDGSPSIIEHQNIHDNNFDKTDKYVSFLELLQDNETNLGIFNGEEMTPRKLAQDLASYAYLANNENGAIGFRDFININYFNILDISKNIRDINNNLETNNILVNFEKQFYQHNPEEAYIISDANISITDFDFVNYEALSEKNILEKELSKNIIISKGNLFKLLTNFTLKENKYNFIAIRDTSIRLSDNQYKLFQWNGLQYVQIPVLGTFGFNEYNPLDNNQKSLIYPEIGNDIMQKQSIGTVKNIENSDITDILDLSNGIQSLMTQITKSSNARYSKFAQELLPYIDNSTKIVVENIEIGNGNTLKTACYNSENNTIYISPDIIQNLRVKSEELNTVLSEVILEEILHSLTKNELLKHGKLDSSKNYIPNDNAPIFVTKLIKLYETSKSKLPYDKITQENYYNKDIFEFMVGAFVSDEFKQKLDNTMVDGKSLFDMFKDAIAAMVRFVKGASYSDETIKTVYDLIKYRQNTQTTENISNVMGDMKKKDTSVEVDINNIIGNERPTVVDRTSIKNMKTYSREISNQILQDFKAGKELIITPTNLRSRNSAEFAYMEDLINYVNSVKSSNKSLLDIVNIKNIDNNTQIISLKNTDISSSPRNFYINELPDIHKCK